MAPGDVQHHSNCMAQGTEVNLYCPCFFSNTMNNGKFYSVFIQLLQRKCSDKWLCIDHHHFAHTSRHVHGLEEKSGTYML